MAFLSYLFEIGMSCFSISFKTNPPFCLGLNLSKQPSSLLLDCPCRLTGFELVTELEP